MIPKQHYYLFTFLRAQGNSTVHYGVVMGLKYQRVTANMIKHAREQSGAPFDASMLSASYLGEMTEDEYANAPM